jgi:hypothetical protein
VTTDGAAFWVSGNASSSSLGGVAYVPFGSFGGSAQILNLPSNVRWLQIAFGQLYATSSSVDFSVFSIGSGLPTVPGQTATNLPGLPISGPNFYGFVILDLDPMIPGPDTMYIADDLSAASGGGVQKWKLDLATTTWSLAATLNVAGGATGYRGLTGWSAGGVVTLVATSTEQVSNHMVVFVDSTASTGDSTAVTSSVVSTSATNTVYRGAALSPQ